MADGKRFRYITRSVLAAAGGPRMVSFRDRTDDVCSADRFHCHRGRFKSGRVSRSFLAGRWFVFWGVGVRLGLAGLRQFFQPGFTAKEIFHIGGDEALPLVRELGVANVATAAVGLLSLVFPSFTLPVGSRPAFSTVSPG